MNIIEYIPKGYKNAVSREELCRRSGMTDRSIRTHIAEANAKGDVILNCGNGYFRYSGKKDNRYLNEYLAIEKSRVKTILRKIRKMEQAKR